MRSLVELDCMEYERGSHRLARMEVPALRLRLAAIPANTSSATSDGSRPLDLISSEPLHAVPNVSILDERENTDPFSH
jgi:hypothetical protein